MGEAHARHREAPWWFYKEVQVSSRTVRVILANHLQERIRTVANANMENLYDQGKAIPPYQRKGACPVQSRQMEMGGMTQLLSVNSELGHTQGKENSYFN